MLASMRRSLASKVVFVTGASAGIGEAVAREAARRGGKVVLAARRFDRVESIAAELRSAGHQALAVACDVTRDGDLEDAVERTHQLGPIDVLVANAGFGVQGRLERLSLDDYRRQFETNVFGVIRSIKAALPDLKRTRGALGVVGSANGYLSIPGWSAYCMSKHAVRSLCDCLRHELSPYGVGVTHLAPGFIESDFRRVDNAGQLREDATDVVPGWLQMPTRSAARRILDAIQNREAERVITGHARIVIGLARHTPALVSVAMGASRKLIQSLSKEA